MSERNIEIAAKALVEAAPPGSKIILFGSHATGRARPDSDLDFLVIEPEVEDGLGEIHRLRKAVSAAFGDILQPMDIMVTDEAHFRQDENVPNTLAFEAARDGRTYE